jgi:hypothetical protein
VPRLAAFKRCAFASHVQLGGWRTRQLSQRAEVERSSFRIVFLLCSHRGRNTSWEV